MKLRQGIEHHHSRLVNLIHEFPKSLRLRKIMEGTGGQVSIADLLAYHIGWGTCLLQWYGAGLKGRDPEMPGCGFKKWDYVGIAEHFYHSNAYDSYHGQEKAFDDVVKEILSFVHQEDVKGRLDQLGVWPWCRLASGKEWPLSKWVRVNTVSPYKRSYSLIKRHLKQLQ